MKRKRLAQYIKELRTGRAWSQAQLADIASVNIRTIQRLEKTGQSSYETLLAVAAAFDIDVQELTIFYNQNTLFESEVSKDGLYISLLNHRVSVNWLSSKKSFWLGLLLAFPAIFFIIASLAKYNLGIAFLYQPWEWLFSLQESLPVINNGLPLLFVGGLSAAFLLNVIHVLSLSVSRKQWLKGTIILNPKIANLVMFSLSTGFLLLLMGYVIAENFAVR